MTQTTLIIAGIIVLLVVLTIVGLLSRYRKCPSDQLLVVYGKVGGTSAAKMYPGGGVFVWPVIQDYKTMSMRPFQIISSVEGPDKNTIRTRVKVALTTAISQDSSIQQNAATRFLSANESEVQDQLKTILDGSIRLIIASMSVEELNSDRDAFKTKVNENLGNELSKVGYDITNINIQEISDEQDILKNLSKKKETDARAQAEADIADKEKDGAIRKAKIQKDQEIEVATADKERETTVAQTKQEQAVQVADIEKERETQIAETLKIKDIKLAETEKDKQTGIAQQKAEQEANIANADADAESKKAAAKARKISAIAKAEAEAESVKNEQEALKQIRIIKAQQEQEAENTKNIQEKEAKEAEYESDKKQRKAEADKKAGVAEQTAKIAVAEATAKAGQAEADAIKKVETAKVEAKMAVLKTEQDKQLEVNEAAALAKDAELNAKEIIPAQKQKEKTILEAEAIKEKAILEAEAEKQRILKEAEAEAEGTKLRMNAEAEGTKAKKLAEAEGQKALLFAEAEALQKREMAPALALQKMVESFGGNPDLLVQYKMVDQYKGIAEAQSKVLEHVHLGNVTVYGDSNTGAQVAKSFIENFAPALDMINAGVKGQFKELFKGKKTEELPENPKTDENFEEVK